jgi:hypothetical protein
MNFSAIMRKPGTVQLMRISLITAILSFTTITFMQATPGKGQNMATEKVAIGLNHQSLETAIRQMEQLSPFVYYYRKADIKPFSNLFLPHSIRSVDKTLEELLKNTFMTYRQVDRNIFIERQNQQTEYEIRGRVVDISHKSVEFAKVKLIKAKDRQMLQTIQTDTAGYFKLHTTQKGDYLITITSAGMDSVSVSLTLSDLKIVELPEITLSATAIQLKQISITSKRPFIEQKIDRTVVNIYALIGNAGTTALDVLEKSPGVRVDQNGGISLKGKAGVTIFIDNKPTYLSGEDLQSYLRSLPSSTLDQIELMTNPPAQYDAAGNAGIINIKTKKSTTGGFNGGLSLAYTQGKYSRSNNSFNFNYRTGGLNVFGNLSYNKLHSFNDLYINREYLNSSFDQHTYIERAGHAWGSKFGADYYASDKTTFGVVINGILRPFTDDFDSRASLLGEASKLDSSVLARNLEHHNNKNGGINLNFRHAFDKNGKELTVDLDHIIYKSHISQQFDNTTYLPDQTLLSRDQLNGDLPGDVRIYAAKTDYTLPLAGQIKLMGGLKTSFTKTDNLVDYVTVINKIAIPDYNRSNHFIYRENINAAYLNLNKEFDRLSLQAGLRFENTVSEGHQLGNPQRPDSVFHRNYNSLFPTFYLLYKSDSTSNNQFGLRVGRRIDRPYYQDLNPFIRPIDKFTFFAGNPLLNPSYSTDFELSHTFKNKITTTLGYGRAVKTLGETFQIINGLYYDRPGNTGLSIYKSLTVDATFDPANWLNIHIYADITRNEYTGIIYNSVLINKRTHFYVNPLLQFKLSETWSAQLDGSYLSSFAAGQLIMHRRGQINLAASKKLSASASVKLALNDLFYLSRNNADIISLVQASASFRNRNDTRYALLSFSYRFGKAISDQRKHDANGVESEKNRVKQ